MNYKVISISLDATTTKALESRLKSLGMSRSEYVRHLIRQEAAAQKTATKEAKSKAPTYRNANAS